jgi:hypothetical protein
LATSSFLNVSIFGDPQSLDNEAHECIQIRSQADLKPAMERSRGLLWVQGPRRADQLCRAAQNSPTGTHNPLRAGREKKQTSFFEYQCSVKFRQPNQSTAKNHHTPSFSSLFPHFYRVAIATPTVFSDTEDSTFGLR